MLTYFVLTLYCLTCQPLQVLTLHNIPSYSAGSAIWADHYCRDMGDILSGDYERRNMEIASPAGSVAAHNALIVYTCERESAEF